MTPSDVDAVVKIEQAVQAHPWTRGNFTDALSHGNECWVDDADGEIVCYAILMRVLDEAELLNIGVAANRQRSGLGRGLLNEIVRASRDHAIHRIFLEVRPSNLAAVALYRDSGFVTIGMRQNYYQNASGMEDALVMACNLIGESNGQA
ncbi:MAG: ribosomal protein S18-alanine N-acetyltransferase [Gallionella sp.]